MNVTYGGMLGPKIEQIDLRYCCMSASFEAKEDRHPQQVMRSLGVTYKKAIPQSLADQWWFMDCSNVPDELPVFLSRM